MKPSVNHKPKTSKSEEASKKNIYEYSHKGKARIIQRIEELETEWDIERALELNAAITGIAGTALALTVNKKWFVLTLAATAFMAQHAFQGWCPPVAILRRFGFRTKAEINREKMALKALKGDFKNIETADDVWAAVAD